MKLAEDYIKRHKIEKPIVQYVDHASLILKSTNPREKNQILTATLRMESESNKPPVFAFVILANPIANNSNASEFNNITLIPSHMMIDEKWAWDDYENKITAWASGVSDKYVALNKEEVVCTIWKTFVILNDKWLSHFFPIKLFSILIDSLSTDFKSSHLAIEKIEQWMRDEQEKFYSVWSKMKNNCNLENYADWLIKFINK
jgi:hypothetical protein